MAQYTITNVPAPIDFEGCSEIVKRTIANAKNLLMCRMGEIPYDRLRGFNPALYDLPIEQMRAELLPEVNRVLLWEPDVEAVSATCEADENGEIIITVVIEVNLVE